jgi:hypothetical protein
MNIPVRTEIITIEKIEKGRVFEGQGSWPAHRFNNPQVGDTFEVVMQAANIISVKRKKHNRRK